MSLDVMKEVMMYAGNLRINRKRRVGIKAGEWEKTPPTTAHTLILITMAQFSNDETRECQISMDMLQRITRIDERTLRRYLRELEDAGAFARQPQKLPNGRKAVNRFTMHAMPGAPEDLPKFGAWRSHMRYIEKYLTEEEASE